MKTRFPKIVFLNQVTGRLFKELAEDLSERFGPSVLYTGDANVKRVHPNLEIVLGPNYIRKSALTKAGSWMLYATCATWFLTQLKGNPLVFFVSNPPFLSLIGPIFSKLRQMKYVVLVYDIYPDAFERFGRISEGGIVANGWRMMQRFFLERAMAVFTIGECMAERLERSYDPKKTLVGQTIIIHNWADHEFIKPIPKKENPFAMEYGLCDTFNVMYSGNLGEVHDLDTMLDTAKMFREDQRVRFVVIGEGYNKPMIEKKIREEGLQNVLMLPLQPEERLPFSLSCADLSVVSLRRGGEGVSFPSKVYYNMAAGCALLIVASGRTGLKDIVQKHRCGFILEQGDIYGFTKAIMSCLEDPKMLQDMKIRARKAIEEEYNRQNQTRKYIEVIEKII